MSLSDISEFLPMIAVLAASAAPLASYVLAKLSASIAFWICVATAVLPTSVSREVTLPVNSVTVPLVASPALFITVLINVVNEYKAKRYT